METTPTCRGYLSCSKVWLKIWIGDSPSSKKPYYDLPHHHKFHHHNFHHHEVLTHRPREDNQGMHSVNIPTSPRAMTKANTDSIDKTINVEDIGEYNRHTKMASKTMNGGRKEVTADIEITIEMN